MNTPSGHDDLRRRRRELVISEIERTATIASETFRWAVTSLLLLNGSALIAMLGVDELRAAFMSGPAWLFAGGIVASLGSGLALAGGFAAAALGMIERLWADDDLTQPTFAKFSKAVRSGRLAIALGSLFIAASALLFIAGCVELGNAQPAQAKVIALDQDTGSAAEETTKLPERAK